MEHKEETGTVTEIPVIRIVPSPFLPRRVFDDASLLSLSESIRKDGILQPLIVCEGQNEEEYELISGERRLRAARLIGLLSVPCVILDSCSRRAAELSLIDSLWDGNSDMFTQAAQIAALIDLHAMTQEQIAHTLSVSQSFIANKLRILRLTSEERELILSAGLSERHARAFLRVRDPDRRLDTVRLAADHAWNVAETEAYIDGLLSSAHDGIPEIKPLPAHAPAPTRKPHKFVIKDIRLLFNSFEHTADLLRGSGITVRTEQTESADAYRYLITVPKTGMNDGHGTALPISSESTAS